jgi:hypothetical protein
VHYIKRRESTWNRNRAGANAGLHTKAIWHGDPLPAGRITNMTPEPRHCGQPIDQYRSLPCWADHRDGCAAKGCHARLTDPRGRHGCDEGIDCIATSLGSHKARLGG